MATKKQPAQTGALPAVAITAALKEPAPPPISDVLTIRRVDNGFTLEASTNSGFGGREISKRVAPGAAALQTEVAAWVNPTPKKR